MLKVLALVASNRMPNNDVMYQSLATLVELDVVKVEKSEQKNLRRLLKSLDVSKYDRILMDLHFKRIVKQARFIKTIKNLVIYEEDACQNYIESSKWYGKFLSFYKKLDSFRLLCTSANLAERLINEGVDAHCIVKGYDHLVLKNLKLKRDIKLGFIGRLESSVYTKRREFLLSMKKANGLKLLRTEPGIEYLNMLNRIDVFLSADIGLGEYMIKNFEAMACGCLLVAYRQAGEEEQLGLKDMENVVLYSNKFELQEKLDLLEANPVLKKEIIFKSEQLAKKRFSYQAVSECIFNVLQNNFFVKPGRKVSLIEKARSRIDS